MKGIWIDGKEMMPILPPPCPNGKAKLTYEELERRYRTTMSYLSVARAKNKILKERIAELRTLLTAAIKIADNSARLDEIFNTNTNNKESENGNH